MPRPVEVMILAEGVCRLRVKSVPDDLLSPFAIPAIATPKQAIQTSSLLPQHGPPWAPGLPAQIPMFSSLCCRLNCQVSHTIGHIVTVIAKCT